MKRTLIAAILVLMMGAGIAMLSPATVSTVAAASTSDVCASHKFFGLVPWYQYLQLRSTDDKAGGKYCDVSFSLLPNGDQPSSIPLVLLAILEDMVRIAGLVAMFYVIFGGVKYITSQGSPDGTKQAQQTVVNALIGLTIAILAAAFVSYIGRRIAGS